MSQLSSKRQEKQRRNYISSYGQLKRQGIVKMTIRWPREIFTKLDRIGGAADNRYMSKNMQLLRIIEEYVNEREGENDDDVKDGKGRGAPLQGNTQTTEPAFTSAPQQPPAKQEREERDTS
jgi:hypothetical protein